MERKRKSTSGSEIGRGRGPEAGRSRRGRKGGL